MNQIVKFSPEKASLVDIRTDSKKFPRLYTYSREDAVNQMNIILLMAFQYRGQQADTQTVIQISHSLIELLLEDEYNIGTKYLSFEEIKRVVRKAALGMGKEMFGISVSSVFQALAEYCKGEGKAADQAAKEQFSRQQELRRSIVASMIEGYAESMITNK